MYRGFGEGSRSSRAGYRVLELVFARGVGEVFTGEQDPEGVDRRDGVPFLEELFVGLRILGDEDAGDPDFDSVEL